MKAFAIELLRAARTTVAVTSLVVASGATAWAQEEAAPAADPAATPAAAPADAAAPAEAATIPVETGSAGTAPKAAEKEAQELDTIEVTGSRIKRSDYETESPVLVIKREDIEKTGLVSIGDILQSLPQAGAALSRANNNGGTGETNIDLRNLGSNRVLVLVNGRRWVGSTNSLNTSGVDLSSIPISIIDSIEVLKDGASAIYGSDAIAGVVNIKTRRDFVGAEVRGQVNSTDKGDGLEKLLSFAGGTVAGKTSVFMNLEYADQDALYARQRKQSAVPRFGIDDASRGSPFFIPNTRTIFIPTPQNAVAINSAAGDPTITGPCHDITTALAEDDTTGDLPGFPLSGAATLCDITLDPNTFNRLDPNTPYDFTRYDLNRDAYNYAPVNYLITPNQRTAVYSQLSHQVFDNVRFSSEVLYNVRKSSQQLAETPDGLGDLLGIKPFSFGYVDKTNPYNPTNPASPYYIPGTQAQDIGRGDPGAGVVGLGAVLKRFVETGPRLFKQTAETYRMGGGLDGNFDFIARNFSWDAGAAYTETSLKNISSGLINNEHLARASGPLADCTGIEDSTGQVGDVPAPPIAQGCLPFDWFGGANSPFNTKEVMNYITYTGVDSYRSQENVYYANISTDIGELARFLAGPLGIAGGVEVRKEAYAGTPDPLKANNTSSTNAQSATSGHYTAQEMYTEIRIPALADVTWDNVGLGMGWMKGRSLVKELEVSLAGRYSKYTGFGDNFSYKGGVRYKPYDDLVLRGTYSTAFRAPAITELYLGSLTSFPSVVDPCNDTTDNENAAANCGAADGAGSPSQIATVFGGNPELKPETAKTLSLGIVYSPSYLPDFNMYIDWYQIKLKDAISVIGPQQILDLCYNAPPGQGAYCDKIVRNDSNQLAQINDVFVNFASLNVSGVDFNFDWLLPLPKFAQGFGTFKWLFDGSYVTQYDTVSPTTQGDRTVGIVGYDFGGQGATPRVKFKTGLTWNLGNWEANWAMRYIHHVIESCDDGLQQGEPKGDVLENPTPVKSLTEYGLCSEPNNTVIGPANQLDDTYYNDIQGSYTFAGWNTKLTLGVNNVLDQDPPFASTAFEGSYDKNTYLPWGSRTPYLNFQVNF